jgi:hypothetical protein
MSSGAKLGHTNLAVRSIHLQGIANAEIIATFHVRKAPMIPATTGLRIQSVRPRRTGTGRVEEEQSGLAGARRPSIGGASV